MKTSCVFALAVLGASSQTVNAQTTAQATWQLSLDNGATWQVGSVVAPQSQGAVLVRMSVTVLDGSQATSGTSVHFSAANLESYVTTTAQTVDTMSSPLAHQVSSPGNPFLRPGPFAGRRVGNILALDRRNDSTPLGNAPAVFVLNEGTSSEGSRTFNPLTLLQYQLNLDGTLGDRSFSSLFLPIVTPAASIGQHQVGVFDYRSGALVARVVDVTQTPATLTVIPAPGSAVVMVGAAVLAARRRR
jgi:hypothetical protein